jgi:hypothetical protein
VDPEGLVDFEGLADPLQKKEEEEEDCPMVVCLKGQPA